MDYQKAWQALLRAAELAPANSRYLNETGIMARELGHYDAAIGYFEKSLDIDLNSFGPDHPNVAKTWNNLGLVWNEKGNTNKAREYFEKALTIFRKAELEHMVRSVEENLRSLPGS